MRSKQVIFVVLSLCTVSTLLFRVYQAFIRPGEDLAEFFSSEFFCFFINIVGFVVMALVAKFLRDPDDEFSSCSSCAERPDECDSLPDSRISRNGFAMFFSIILGVVTSINGVIMLQKYITGFRSANPFFEGVFAVAAGIIFILTGMCYKTGRNLFKNNELLAIIPVAWGVARTVNIFLKYHVTSIVAWNLADVLATVFLSLFLLNHAKYLAGREDFRLSRLRLYGCSAILFILLYVSKALLDCNGNLLSLSSSKNGILCVIFSSITVDVLALVYILAVILSTKVSVNNCGETYCGAGCCS